MDPRERMEVPEQPFQAAMAGLRADIWTALPAIVESFDATRSTVSAQPTIQGLVENEQGIWSNVTLPLCVDVPVLFPGGGPFAITFPLAAGDEGVLVFASRCIDAFWQSGGVQPQAERRMHNLSDGIFLPGRLSQPAKLENVDGSNLQIRSQDGNAYIEMTPAGLVTIKSPTVTVDGNLVVTGTISWPQGELGGTGGIIEGAITATGEITAGEGTLGAVKLSTHTHGGVQAGGATTSPPTPGS